ncbi:hypothetical protein BIW11_02391 [Tropilaelaps mercedesae]|uniref:Uncharacterized protein n=1 Tax=Tropilaelaps mercedesae TaxID=418985 RepID=A0A1V9WYE5_9ACAR|nr:hypothetical protein BIW11_02391 [Tropilaelaps mercedesae]
MSTRSRTNEEISRRLDVSRHILSMLGSRCRAITVKIALVVCVASAHAGLENSPGWQPAVSSGWTEAQSSGWAPSPSGWEAASPSSGWESAPVSTGWESAAPASSGWEPAATVSSGWEPAAPVSSGWQPAPEKKIIIVKQQNQQQNVGRSLTVAGPTHVIKTIHQVRTVDHGGKILHKSNQQQAKVFVVKSVGSAEVKHTQPQGWPQKVQAGWETSSGW